MRVAILGSGAMGTVMGAFLTKNGLSVEMIDNYEEHVKVMQAQGATITGFANLTVPVTAYTTVQMHGVYDLIFLFTKQLSNMQLLPAILPFLHDKSTICTLQNGVPEPYVAEFVGKERTVGGTVLWGATFIKPGVSELTQDISTSDHLFEIGEISGEITERIGIVADVLRLMGPVKVTTTLMASRWGKLVNNACMSGMSAVCGATFGEIRDHPVARACLSYLGQEVKVCCEADGYQLPVLLGNCSPDSLGFQSQEVFDESQRMFISMYKGFDLAKASMLQDLEKGRQTEVRMINGYVCQTGNQYDIQTPFNDKVVEIVSAIEQGRMSCSMENLNLFPPEWFRFQFYKA